MRRSILFILSVFFLSACDEELPESDLTGDKYIRGRLFLVDTLTQQANGLPLAKKKITISYTSSSDPNNFLMSTTTDEEGYFIFQNLKNAIVYTIRYEEKVGDIIYTANKEVKAPNDTMRLNAFIATSKQPGFYFTVLDPAGNRISNINVCVYKNELLFNESTACEASDFQLKSDVYGRVYKFGILPGKYFLKATTKINNVDYSVKKIIEVGNFLKIDLLQLERVLSVPVGFQYTVIDTTGTKISGVNLCVFTSRVLSGGKSCSGSTYQIITDQEGKANKVGLKPGKYFIYGTIKTYNNLNSDSLIYEGLDSVLVEENKVANRELVLKNAKIK